MRARPFLDRISRRSAPAALRAVAACVALALSGCDAGGGGGGGGGGGEDAGRSAVEPPSAATHLPSASSPSAGPVPAVGAVTNAPGAAGPASSGSAPEPGADIPLLGTPEEATRFLMRATFGGTPDAADALVGTDPAAFLAAELGRPGSWVLPELRAAAERGESVSPGAARTAMWNAMAGGDDQLRQRMVFALSQILVVSELSLGQRPLTSAHYVDALRRHAFGNYRDLLEEVTWTPAMAIYLTYLHNRRAGVAGGNVPDENYARELLQLFTIGTEVLEPDGTPRRAADGGTIETYTNEDIVGLSRVFTGLGRKSSGNFFHADTDGEYSRLQMWDEASSGGKASNVQHEPGEKRFLGTTIPAGTPGERSISLALDAIFAHPNVGPFLARQLIQRFTASDPAPAYVERVAAAFDAGRHVAANGTAFGTGRRGDLSATLAAILLDPSLHESHARPGDGREREGKLREPVLRFVHWARAFGASPIAAKNESLLVANPWREDRLAQGPLQSPSVFGFYRPDHRARLTRSGELGMTAPELQIMGQGHTTYFANAMTGFVFDASHQPSGTPAAFSPDYTREIALADTPDALVAHLDRYLLAGRLDEATRARMVETVEAIAIDEDDPRDALETRARLAVLMAVTSPAFAVVH